MQQKKALITGNSSGLGLGLTEVFLKRGYRVYGCSRRGCPLTDDINDINDIQCDLSDFDQISARLEQLLQGVNALDLIILNAGILGEIKPMRENSLDELNQIMDMNVWSNKVILDWLLQSGMNVKQILLMSSGASVLGNSGWGGYAMSKAALNMLAKLYSHEFTRTHIAAIAPGLIDTKMMDYLCNEADSERFPALRRIQQARGTETMLTPVQAAERIASVLEDFIQFDSGSFVDIRQIIAPDEYEKLMNAFKNK